MFWSCNPLDLTVAWRQTTDCSDRNETLSSVGLPATLSIFPVYFYGLLHILKGIFFPPTVKKWEWCMKFKQKEITARATSLYKRYSDLWRQIGFWSVFLFWRHLMHILHPALQRGVDISDDKLITLQPFHLPLVPMCLCNVYENFHLCISLGPRCAAYSNQPITFFLLLRDPMVDLVFFFSEPPSGAGLCLKWRWHWGRCWSALQQKDFLNVCFYLLQCPLCPSASAI